MKNLRDTAVLSLIGGISFICLLFIHSYNRINHSNSSNEIKKGVAFGYDPSTGFVDKTIEEVAKVK